jgi:hypothetical protein
LKAAARVATIAVAPLVLACSANHHSIFRNQPLDGEKPSITTIDAKQRAILYLKAKGKRREEIQRFCSEPSPDVFSVVAQALTAGGSFGKTADPKSLEATLNAAFSTAEQGSTIPRTQTINMLRELMFRTCERYLSGAYSDLEMSVQAVRDQRLMISILAIEQLTGAVTPRPVVIGAAGSSSSGAGGDAIVRLDDAKKAKEAAAKAKESAQATFDTINGNEKVCDAIAEVLKSGKTLTDEQTAKKKECDKSRSDLTAASQRAAESSDYFAQLQRLASGTGGAVATYLSSSAPGGLDRAHTESVEKVSNAVKEIVLKNFKDDTEVMLFCLKVLREADLLGLQEAAKSDDPKLKLADETIKEYTAVRESCLSYLTARVDSKEKALALDAETLASAAAMGSIGTDQFAHYWPTLKQAVTNSNSKSKFIADLKERLLSSEVGKAACFEKAATEDDYRRCFLELPARVQRYLSRSQ